MIFKYGSKEIEFLKEQDSVLAKAIDKFGHIERSIEPDLFSSVIFHIIAQQISNAAQNTVRKRLIDSVESVTCENIRSLGREGIHRLGISYRKADSIIEFANKVCAGEFDINKLFEKSDEDVIKELSTLRGIGVWTAEMIMIFCMQRPNILSYNDFSIKKGLCTLYGFKNIDKKTFDAFKEKFSPYGTVASFYLWAVGNETNTAEVKSAVKSAVESDVMSAIYKTKYGNIEIGYTNEHIVYSWFTDEKVNHNTSVLSDLAYSQICEYLNAKRKTFNLPIKIKGTAFQKSVWDELLKIPYGETISYKEVAVAVNSNKAYRAVGMACNKNPLGIIIPCHRVIGSSGKLTGYAGGLDIKKMLLSLEKSNIE